MSKILLENYAWLIETIHNAGTITLKGINKKWMDEERGDKPIPPRTFHDWKNAAEELFGVNIGCQRKGGYMYYIEHPENIDATGLRRWLLNSIYVNNLLAKNLEIKDRILIEEIPSSTKHLSAILDSIKKNKTLKITYKSFDKTDGHTFEAQPYCLKLFRQRWYLISYNTEEQRLKTYALDRIQALEITPITFSVPRTFNASRQFKNYFGITLGTTNVENIKIKATAKQAKYFRTLKLHHSQKEIETTEDYSIFTYKLCPEYDFKREILSNGDAVEILEPQWLRKEIAQTISKVNNIYNSQIYQK